MEEKGISIISRAISAGGIERDVENSWIQYFFVYFKFGFFSFCCPYYFKYDKIAKKYKPASFPIQKVICASVQILSLLVLVTNFRIIRAQDLQKNPMLYIELASLGLNTCYQCGVFYTVWFKMHLFTQLLDTLRFTMMARFARGDIFKMKLLILFICTVSLVQAFVSFLYGVEEEEWYLDKFLDIMVRRGKYMFFMKPETELSATEANVITALYFVATFYNQLLKNTADIVGTISVLFFRHILQDWLHAMKDEGYTAALFVQTYDAFQIMLTKLNYAIGFFIFFFFLGPIPYYAINIITMLDASDAFLLLSNLIYLLNYFTTIIMSARVNNMAQELKDWLTTTERFREIPSAKLDLILHDISEYDIALSGLGFFSASSGLVGTIVSLILTYAILVVQFKAEVTEGGISNDTILESTTEASVLH